MRDKHVLIQFTPKSAEAVRGIHQSSRTWDKEDGEVEKAQEANSQTA